MKCIHLDKQYDSITEACVGAWMLEAKALGVIHTYYEQVEYLLAHRQTHMVPKQLKTKIRYDERTLLGAARYTADFVVEVADAAIALHLTKTGVLTAGVGAHHNVYSYTENTVFVIDVKGEGGRHASGAKFSLTQKFLHATNGIYCNKLVPCARNPKAKSVSFFMLCGLPSELPQECYLADGTDFRQPWRDMFTGCPGIAEVFSC